NDYVTDNPRQVVMTQDTIFTAYFAHPAGIDATGESAFSLSPNPTEGNVTITLPAPASNDTKLTLHDVAGHEVMTIGIPAGQGVTSFSLRHLPAGAYYATLHQDGKLSTQKLVLK
ncbi:MAG: T9SS type A sorting domain-containing protein, partial [Bacteroidales bacterium]|nr:T9SS type A sorting domain-containing protein [Bacteroidales bacterium]